MDPGENIKTSPYKTQAFISHIFSDHWRHEVGEGTARRGEARRGGTEHLR